MKLMLKRHIIPMVALILVSSLVTGCGTTSQQSPPSNSSVGHCSAQFQPVIQRLTSVRPSSQSIYFISGIHLYALNAGDGTLRWCMSAAYTNSPRPAPLGNAASALFREKPLSLPEGFTNLTISNGIIYTCSRDGYTYAFQSSSGTLLWRQNTGFASVSAPTVVGNTVYVSSGTIYALNAKDGSVRWSYPTSAVNNSSPVIVNGVLYTGSYSSHVYALNAATGARLWQYATNGIVVVDPVVADGTVFFGSGTDIYTSTIYAIRALDGKLLWHGMSVGSSLAVSHNVLYAGSSNYLYKLNSHNGAILWRCRVATPFNSLIANGVIYIASGSSGMDAFNEDSGKLLWHNALNSMQVGVTTRPVLIRGEVYIETIDEGVSPFKVFLHALNARNGAENWHANTTEDASSINIAA